MAHIFIPDDLRASAASRAADAGYASVDDFIAALVRAEAIGAPAGLTVDDDSALQRIVTSRMDGPWVDADAAGFARIRETFRSALDVQDSGGGTAPKNGPQP